MDGESETYVPEVVPESDREYYESQNRFGNRVGWGERPAVLVVDMTLAFVGENRAVGDPCVEATERLLGAAREAGVPVVYAKPNPAGTYPDGYPVTTKASPASSRGPDPSDSRDPESASDATDDPGARTGEADREEWLANLDRIVPALEPREDDPVVRKSRASAFFDTHLGNVLRYYGVDTLVVAGMTTSGCIRSTVVDSHSSNFRTIVPEECVADPSEISHEVGLFDMDMKYADVTPLSDVLERF